MVITPHGVPSGSLLLLPLPLPHLHLTESRIAQNAAIEVAERVRGGTGKNNSMCSFDYLKISHINLKCFPALMLLHSFIFLAFTFHPKCVVVEEPIDADESSVFTGQSEAVTLMTLLYPHRRTSTMSGPMTESIWAPLLVYPKAKV